jgi:putative ABC transport system permease protein
VLSYGLTYDDLKRVGSVEGVAELIPMRAFPREVRRRERMSVASVIATTPAFADWTNITLAAGRFLREEDGEGMLNVAVLGSDVAKALFGDEDPLGESVRLGNYFYRVVGVLHEQVKWVAGLAAYDWNTSVYLPLQTCRTRFGERIMIRQAGSLRAEEVPLSAVLVRASNPEKVPGVAEAVRALLEAAHKQKDWDVQTASGR